MELGYARVSTTKQDLERQIDALTKTGIDPSNIYVDKKSGATTNRPGLTALIEYAREGDVITVHTIDRLGRTVRDTLNLIHDLGERGIGVRNLADPIRIDSTDPDDPMAQLAIVMLALFAQMERTYAVERASHARSVAEAKGRRTGRPSVVSEAQIAYAVQLRDAGTSISEIVTKTGLTRSTLYRHMPARPAELLTAAPAAPAETAGTAGEDLGFRLDCPTCGYRPPTRRDLIPHCRDLETVWLHLDPAGNIREERHCARCQPHDAVASVNCERCGDGPLIAGVGNTGELPAAVQNWLAERGWTNLVCPHHR